MDTSQIHDLRGLKKSFRAKALSARDGLAADQRIMKSALIFERLLGLRAVSERAVWFVYVSFRSEVETGPLIRRLLAEGKQVSVPFVDRASKIMTPSLVIDPGRDLAPGSLGIYEPRPGCLRPVPAGSIEIAIVPGAAFSADGGRIGYGAGYYDRFLKMSGAITAGLAFDMQIFETLPQDPVRDVPLDLVVTENRAIDCAARRGHSCLR